MRRSLAKYTTQPPGGILLKKLKSFEVTLNFYLSLFRQWKTGYVLNHAG